MQSKDAINTATRLVVFPFLTDYSALVDSIWLLLVHATTLTESKENIDLKKERQERTWYYARIRRYHAPEQRSNIHYISD